MTESMDLKEQIATQLNCNFFASTPTTRKVTETKAVNIINLIKQPENIKALLDTPEGKRALEEAGWVKHEIVTIKLGLNPYTPDSKF